VIGLSILPARTTHRPARDGFAETEQNGRRDRRVGGIIPDQDIDSLKKIGVGAIFQPGTTMDNIVQFIRGNVKPRGVPVS